MNKWLRAFLLLLQIGGGVLGFVIIGRVLLAGNQTPVTVMFNAAFLVVFAFGILAGVALIKKPGLGLVLSLIFQGIQIRWHAAAVRPRRFAFSDMPTQPAMGPGSPSAGEPSSWRGS